MSPADRLCLAGNSAARNINSAPYLYAARSDAQRIPESLAERMQSRRGNLMQYLRRILERLPDMDVLERRDAAKTIRQITDLIQSEKA